MPKPFSGFTYDQFLTSMLVGYRNDEDSYGHLAVPTILHTDESGLYPIIKQSEWMRLSSAVRPSSAPAAMAGYGMETSQFKTTRWGYKQPVDIDDAAKAKDPVDLEMAAIQHVADQLYMRNEQAFAAAAFTAGQWGTTDQTGVASGPVANQFVRWNVTTATPGKDIRALASAMKKNTGKRPNVMFVPDDVSAAVEFCPDVVARVQYVDPNAIMQRRVINTEALAGYFGVSKYVLCGSTYNTALEAGAQTMSFFSTNSVLLAYIDPGHLNGDLSLANARFRPTALAAIRYNLPGSQNGKRVRSYFSDELKSDVVEGDESFVYHKPLTELATNSGKNPLGQLLVNVLS